MADEKIWSDFIYDLKTKNDIVDIISSYLPVTQKGRGFWTLCPFHNDRNPSMSINKEGQYYHCFVCRAGGDVIKFVQEYESFTFFEAVELLAKRANMEVPLFNTNFDKDIAQKKKLKDDCFAACLVAAKFYNKNLYSSNGKHALTYLKKRGLSLSAIKQFGFGLSTDWTSLVDALKESGISTEVALKAGLIGKRKEGSFFDSLAQRLIIPIFDINGKVIAFGGRTFSEDKTIAKYKNTFITPVFDKSKTLYGLNFAKKAKQGGNLDFIIIVEGYMDAVMLHQAGFVQAVASMGTSLTVEQARLIKRLVSTVYICFDGDAAGKGATLRGLDLLKEQGLEVKVAEMPLDKDPDEYIKQNGSQAYKSLLAKSLPLTDYKLKLSKQKYLPKTESKAAINDFRRKYTEEALSLLKPLSAVERETYIKAVSEDTGLSVDFLRKQLENNSVVKQQAQENVSLIKNGQLKAEAFVLACKLNNKSYADDDKTFVSRSDFINEVFDYIKICRKSNKRATLGDLYRLDKAANNEEVISTIINAPFLSDEIDRLCYLDCLEMLTKTKLTQQLEELKNAYTIESDADIKRDILTKIAVLTQEINAKA
mgnify:CR=1 FL=1